MTLEQVIEIIERYKLRIPPTVYYELLADVQEVEEEQEPRKGHWIVAKGSYLGMRNACCSNCKDFYTNDWNVMNYCPNCGAEMESEEV